jgi:predicted DNA binding CopG/RHH family protein
MNQRVRLDKFEQDIENNFKDMLPVPKMEVEMAVIKDAAVLHSKRKKSITLRVQESDLEVMRIKAARLGIPYQTYINILIHKDTQAK